MQPSISLVETNSVARGIFVGDAMMKKADVRLLEARPVCPGKYIVLIGGDVGEVQESHAAGVAAAGDSLVDQLILPNVHLSPFPAMMSATPPGDAEALGIVETISVASTIVSADAAAKAAEVNMLEIRLANGLGGKSYFFLEGAVADVEAAVAAGVGVLAGEGVLVNSVIIPRLHPDMRSTIM
jgi:microcompartment protein CcmL/EutN